MGMAGFSGLKRRNPRLWEQRGCGWDEGGAGRDESGPRKTQREAGHPAMGPSTHCGTPPLPSTNLGTASHP